MHCRVVFAELHKQGSAEGMTDGKESRIKDLAEDGRAQDRMPGFSCWPGAGRRRVDTHPQKGLGFWNTLVLTQQDISCLAAESIIGRLSACAILVVDRYKMAEVVARAYAVVDTSSLSSGHSTRSTGGGRAGGIDSHSGHSGGAKSNNASTNIGTRAIAVRALCLQLGSTDLPLTDRISRAPTGGRVDVRKQVEDFNLVASLTDNTLRDYEAAPWLKEALVTADKKISSAPALFGKGSPLASICSALWLRMLGQVGRLFTIYL